MLTKRSFIFPSSKQGSPHIRLCLAIPNLKLLSALDQNAPILYYPLPSSDPSINNFVAVLVVVFFSVRKKLNTKQFSKKNILTIKYLKLNLHLVCIQVLTVKFINSSFKKGYITHCRIAL